MGSELRSQVLTCSSINVVDEIQASLLFALNLDLTAQPFVEHYAKVGDTVRVEQRSITKDMLSEFIFP